MVFCNKSNCLITSKGVLCHNPYFNRWFSAIKKQYIYIAPITSHNPYFNRWFSAINIITDFKASNLKSQSLF